MNIYTKFLRSAEEEDGDKDGNSRFEKLSCRWKEGRNEGKPWEEGTSARQTSLVAKMMQ